MEYTEQHIIAALSDNFSHQERHMLINDANPSFHHFEQLLLSHLDLFGTIAFYTAELDDIAAMGLVIMAASGYRLIKLDLGNASTFSNIYHHWARAVMRLGLQVPEISQLARAAKLYYMAYAQAATKQENAALKLVTQKRISKFLH